MVMQISTDQKVGGSSPSERAQVRALFALWKSPHCSQDCCQRQHFRPRESCRSRRQRPRGAAPAMRKLISSEGVLYVDG